MDTEKQIRLNFLDETEEYFDLIESNLIGLADMTIDRYKIDPILRSAHSIKGGAAMMSFNTLSRFAHRLEDFLKILRVRYASRQITAEVETLLLQGVDLLRNASKCSRQELETKQFNENEGEVVRLEERARQIFDRLRQHLGDLEDADENALLAQEEDLDPAILIFEEGVDTVLDSFENRLEKLEIAEIPQELAKTARELIDLGKMASLEAFVELCQSIKQKAKSISLSEITSLSEEALKVWRRSYALVLRGRIEKLPSNLEDDFSFNGANTLDSSEEDLSEVEELQSAFELDTAQARSIEADFDFPEEDVFEVEELQSAFELDTAEARSIEADFDFPEEELSEVEELQSAFELDTAKQVPISFPQDINSSLDLSPPNISSVEKMVRVPVSQLKQFNSLFEQLILDRNTINLRLKQLQNVMSLMNQRMTQIETSNTQLKQWYDRASIEGLLANDPRRSILNSVGSLSTQADNQNLAENRSQNNLSRTNIHNRFDPLEMDRYSKIHSICQEQIETIVQLQEVSTDIELGLQDMSQAVRNLNYTTKSIQGNVTRTQMLPFSEVVKRFPRVIRDLSLQFDKQVELKIVGENSFLDRFVIETLRDSLMHLLRNAFDHGIEEPQTRIAAGKSPSGTITIQANSQGANTIITIKDDGAGISLDKIRERVCQMGLSQSEVERISKTELLDFIFEPGFSTTQKATELSGRGVGMDVVRTNLQEIRGNVRVETEPGLGTTFTLKIPSTLSILKVAIIEQAGIILAIPANSIRELVPLEPKLVKTSADNEYLHWNQQEIPLIKVEKTLIYRRLHNSFNLMKDAAIEQTMALVVGDRSTLAALQISRFWHEQESTMRLIDSPVPLPPGIVSSMVFGDGKVIPLVDPMLLIETCLTSELAVEARATYERKGMSTVIGETLSKAGANLSDRNTREESVRDAKANQQLSTVNTIMVVDDSINVRRYLSLTLEKIGYRVEQAKDGQEAVDKLLSGLSIQAVICDMEMPRLDGYGVLEEVRGRPKFTQLPIVMLTSRSSEKHRKLAMSLGASAYFSKPYNEQQLLNQVANLLDSVEKTLD